MKNRIPNLKLFNSFKQYTANCEFLGVETIDDFHARTFTSSFIDSPYGQLKPSRTVKVISNDNFLCKQCEGKAEYVTYQRANDNQQIYISFWIEKTNEYVPLTKDHILAKSLGGTDAFENLQSLCYLCNQEKSDDLVSLDDQSVRSQQQTLLNKDQLDDYKKKVAHFKYARKKMKKLYNTVPWYYRILGVHKFIDKQLIEPMQRKGYLVPEDEE